MIDQVGAVGLGTEFPAAALHVQRSDGTAKLLVEETSGVTAQRDLLRLDNNGDVRFQMVDTSGNPSDWRFNARGSFGKQFLINEFAGGGGSEFVLQGNGNLFITGQLTTAGPSCSGGCDELFDPHYEIESVEEHAESMWQQRHLPALGRTAENEPINLTEKVGGIVNELEKAHIYIERLHEQAKEKDERIRELEQRHNERDAKLARRLSRLETLLGAAPAD